MPAIARLLPLLALTTLLVQAPAGADDVPPYRASANLELVAHIPGSGGTDLEFFSRELREWTDWYGNVHVVPEGEPSVTRHFAMVGNQNASSASGGGPMSGGAKIVDITDPQIPFIAAAVENCRVGQGDIQVAKGGTVAAIAFQSTGGSCQTHDGVTVPRGSALVDLSDVYNPLVVGSAPDTSGSHNQTIHPSGDYLYISTSTGSGKVPIFDISDPANPVKIKNWAPPSGDNPHDIRFNDAGTRAYMAGIGQYRIVNTEDPENPVLISTIDPPGNTIGHDTEITADGAFLFLGEEAGGGGTFPCPGGAVYAYDIRDEANPVLVSIAEAGGGPVTGREVDQVWPVGVVPSQGCTSHVMDLNPDGRSLTLGWYVLGTRIFSFASLYNPDGTPKTIENPSLAYGSRSTGDGLVETGYIVLDGTRTWSAKQYSEVPGYIFSDDVNLGFYVTKIKP